MAFQDREVDDTEAGRIVVLLEGLPDAMAE
jgi:hypothetical protein